MADSTIILVVESDSHFAAKLSETLAEAAFKVHVARRGNDAVTALAVTRPDLVIVDVHLPDISGPALSTTIRHRCAAPILFVNASRRRIRRKEVWDAGADAYVADPTRLGEIRARARALIRRANMDPRTQRDDALELGSIRIDPAGHELVVDGVLVPMTPKEFRLLEILMRAEGRVVSHHALSDQVWGPRETCDLRTLETHISVLRKKLETGSRARAIVNVPKLGFKLIDTSATVKRFTTMPTPEPLRKRASARRTSHDEDAQPEEVFTVSAAPSQDALPGDTGDHRVPA